MQRVKERRKSRGFDDGRSCDFRKGAINFRPRCDSIERVKVCLPDYGGGTHTPLTKEENRFSFLARF